MSSKMTKKTSVFGPNLLSQQHHGTVARLQVSLTVPTADGKGDPGASKQMEICRVQTGGFRLNSRVICRLEHFDSMKHTLHEMPFRHQHSSIVNYVVSHENHHVQMSFLLKRVISPSYVNLPEGMITVSIHMSFLGRKDSLLFRSKFCCSQKNKPKRIQIKNLYNIITDHISEILPKK